MLIHCKKHALYLNNFLWGEWPYCGQDFGHKNGLAMKYVTYPFKIVSLSLCSFSRKYNVLFLFLKLEQSKE